GHVVQDLEGVAQLLAGRLVEGVHVSALEDRFDGEGQRGVYGLAAVGAEGRAGELAEVGGAAGEASRRGPGGGHPDGEGEGLVPVLGIARGALQPEALL